MSTKTLSCKLRVAEVDQIQKIAQAQGETKASLVQRLVRDYLQSGGKVDAVVQSGKPRPPSGVDKGLPSAKTHSADRLPLRKSPSSDTLLGSALPDEGLPTGCLPPVHRPTPTTTLKSTPGGYTGLLDNVDVDARSFFPLPTSRLPVYHNDAEGRPATSPKSSVGNLLLLGLFLWWLVGSESKTAVDHTSQLPAESPSRVDYDLHARILDNAKAYNERMRKAWGYR